MLFFRMSSPLSFSFAPKAHFARLGLVALAVPVVLGAQHAASSSDSSSKKAPVTLADARTPQQCVEAVTTERSAGQAHVHTLPESERSAASARVSADYKAHAASCVKQFDVATAQAAQLPSLIQLYRAAALQPELRQAYERSVALAPDQAGRDQAYMDALDYYGYIMATPERVAVAEQLLARIDSMGPESVELKARAHAAMSDAYPLTDARLQHHADAALAAARAIPDSLRARHRAYTSAMTMAAETYAAAWKFDTAVAILTEAAASVRADSARAREVGTELRRFKLVGTRAPDIAAEHWLNVSKDGSVSHHTPARQAPLEGKVTLVEFTSTSCVWCRVGYPIIRTLSDRYRGRGADVMFVGSVDGEIDGTPAPLDQELAYDKKYWVIDDSLSFPIGIIDTHETKGADGKAYRPDPPLFSRYELGGIPEYIFVDRHGIIRYVQVGHTRDLEERFTKVLDQLLKS